MSGGATPDIGSANNGTRRRHAGHVAAPAHKSARAGFAGANPADGAGEVGGTGEEGQMMNVDLVALLSFVESLGDALTMPVAVLASTALLCAVFLTWRLASWFFASDPYGRRIREPEPWPALNLRPVLRVVRWCRERYAALARKRRENQRSLTP